MRRFRSSYPLDEGSLLDGDGAFVGVNCLDAPDTLQPGYLAGAENVIIDDGKPATRGGCITPLHANLAGVRFPAEFQPMRERWQSDLAYVAGSQVFHAGTHWEAKIAAAIGLEPGSDPDVWEDLAYGPAILFDTPLPVVAYGGGRWQSPSGDIFTLIVCADRLLLGRQWQPIAEIPFDQDTVSGPVTLTQAYNLLIVWRGPALEPLAWDGQSSYVRRLSDFTEDLDDGAELLPNAARASYFQNRLVVPHSRDMLAISDIGEVRYDPATQDEVIDAGSGDPIQAVFPWDRTTLLVFKRGSISALANFIGDLAEMTQIVITEAIGTVAPDSIATWGHVVGFLGPDAYWTVNQVDADRFGLSAKPLSHPIQPYFRRIHWPAVAAAQAITYEGRLYLAVPYSIPGQSYAGGCNAVITLNLSTGGWEGVWTSPHWSIRKWIIAPYWGKLRLHALNGDGTVLLFDDGDVDQVGMETAPIVTRILSRGYNPTSPERLRARRLLLNLSQRGTTYSVACNGSSQALITRANIDRAPNRLRYLTLRRAWDSTNQNLDHATPGREDYTVHMPLDRHLYAGSAGIRLDLEQEWEEGAEFRADSRYYQTAITTERGRLTLRSARLEGIPGRRDSRRKL